MTTKNDFTVEEWEKVAGLPGLVLAGSAWADGKMMPAMREIMAGGEVLQKAAAAAPEGSFERDVFAGAAGQKPAVEGKPSSTTEAVDLLAGQISEGFAILAAKATPEEVEAVRSTLKETAKAVCERLGSGFWGSGSQKVSEGEQAFLDRLDQILDNPAEIPTTPAPAEAGSAAPSADASAAPATEPSTSPESVSEAVFGTEPGSTP
jgi:hypothetical protein